MPSTCIRLVCVVCIQIIHAFTVSVHRTIYVYYIYNCVTVILAFQMMRPHRPDQRRTTYIYTTHNSQNDAKSEYYFLLLLTVSCRRCIYKRNIYSWWIPFIHSAIFFLLLLLHLLTFFDSLLFLYLVTFRLGFISPLISIKFLAGSVHTHIQWLDGIYIFIFQRRWWTVRCEIQSEFYKFCAWRI